jgi:glycosyltransferase involved in cell wall biosynthesis
MDKELKEYRHAPTDCHLTILMPCLNEAETIGICVRKALKSLQKLVIEGEVLVADNGSVDGSQQIALSLGARVIDVPRKGYGEALKAGIEAAQSEWIIMGDADDSYDFGQLESFVEKLQSGYDLVMGCRMPWGGGTIMPGAMPWKHHWIGNPVLSCLGQVFFRAPVTDFHCGLRAFKRESIQRLGLRTEGMEFASEMVIKATLQKLQIAEIPITLHKDGRSRPPHLRSWRDGWRHLRFMLLFSPDWLFIWPGLVITLIGLVGDLLLFSGPIQVGIVQPDRNSLLISAMFVMVGYQTLFFGIFAKIYAYATGLGPKDVQLEKLLNFFNLEKGLIIGLGAIVLGVVLLICAVLRWQAVHFGPLEDRWTFRLVIHAVTILVLGTQTIFGSFFLGILSLQPEPPSQQHNLQLGQ